MTLAIRVLLCATALALAACRPATTIVAEESILRRQLHGIARLIERAQRGPLLPEGGLVVVVAEGWVRELISLELPRREVVAGRYRVEVRSADVSFEDDLGLVRLDGRVTPADSSVEGVFADISVYSSVDVVDLDPESGVLRGRVKPLAFAVRRVSLYLTNPVGRQLLERLARENISAFEALAFPIEIPVNLEQKIDLPGAGPDGPVQFPGAVIPIALTVSQVMSLHGRLWISVAPSRSTAGTATASAG